MNVQHTSSSSSFSSSTRRVPPPMRLEHVTPPPQEMAPPPAAAALLPPSPLRMQSFLNSAKNNTRFFIQLSQQTAGTRNPEEMADYQSAISAWINSVYPHPPAAPLAADSSAGMLRFPPLLQRFLLPAPRMDLLTYQAAALHRHLIQQGSSSSSSSGSSSVPSAVRMPPEPEPMAKKSSALSGYSVAHLLADPHPPGASSDAMHPPSSPDSHSGALIPSNQIISAKLN